MRPIRPGLKQRMIDPDDCLELSRFAAAEAVPELDKDWRRWAVVRLRVREEEVCIDPEFESGTVIVVEYRHSS